ncbi:MAG: glycosyltransferase family 1 protein [Bacteroides sp.]
MKGLFLMFYGFNAFNGISKKIAYQVEALRHNGIEMQICHYETSVVDGTRTWMIDDKVLHCFGNSIWGKIRKRLDYRFILDYIRKERFDFVYWRSDHNANPFTIHFAKQICNLNVKIVVEIPTYPYDQEYINRKIGIWIERHYRHQFYRYIDRIVTFSNDDEIFSCPTIRISNGIDFSQIPLRTKLHDISKELHLVAVAEIHYWHGYDRLIEGLHRYYLSNPEYKVYFHLAGPISGEREQHEVADAVTRYHLEEYVSLYGPLHGEVLEQLFDKGDFAIGSLGRHRSGITHIKTLKNREYAARGFAFAYSECDDDFDAMPYVLKVPADESPIDIQQVINFCHAQTMQPQAIRESISHLSWDEQMKKVVEYLK